MDTVKDVQLSFDCVAATETPAPIPEVDVHALIAEATAAEPAAETMARPTVETLLEKLHATYAPLARVAMWYERLTTIERLANKEGKPEITQKWLAQNPKPDAKLLTACKSIDEEVAFGGEVLGTVLSLIDAYIEPERRISFIAGVATSIAQLHPTITSYVLESLLSQWVLDGRANT